MPPFPFFALLFIVIFAAGVTVWLLTNAGPIVMLAALPTCMLAAVVLRALRK
ncbi:MAG: hypothetical protein WBG95_01070 [Sulfitobacter sp.]